MLTVKRAHARTHPRTQQKRQRKGKSAPRLPADSPADSGGGGDGEVDRAEEEGVGGEGQVHPPGPLQNGPKQLVSGRLRGRWVGEGPVQPEKRSVRLVIFIIFI